MSYPRAILFGIFVFAAAILLNPGPAQMIIAHKRFRLSLNNIASIILLIFAMCIGFFPVEKILNRKSDDDKKLNR